MDDPDDLIIGEWKINMVTGMVIHIVCGIPCLLFNLGSGNMHSVPQHPEIEIPLFVRTVANAIKGRK